MVMNNDPSDVRDKMQKYQEYIGALEEERRKIRVFERELPLCLELVSKAIERCRQEMSRDCFNVQSDQYSEQTSNEGPVLEEFIPIKRNLFTNEDEGEGQQQQEQQLSHKSKNICSQDKSSPFSLKPDWLTSAQLSIQSPDPPIEEDLLSKKLFATEVNRNGYGDYHPFKKKKSSCAALTTGVEKSLTCAAMVPTAAVSSSVDTDGGGGDGGGGGSKGEDKGKSNIKERRCWSTELHRRFLHALQQLGGAHVATPKQIRELMKVDGLTNDEIKSHLQKYRLHTRRLNPTIHNNDPHTAQLVVVGRIWMPPLEYTRKAASFPPSGNTNNAKVVYAPIASLPPSITASRYKTRQCKQQSNYEEKGSQSHSNSPSTTTISPAF
ncbi:transcription factor HHO3-like [Cynara cardunculus var. scolymus]|uniref:Homeodomain-like protein n=1 Tax=Cynara cardunculus var. scolymus TaxID=59895 RepID=A0A103YA52_CYNCS|nr:transcription factor HHO3-like [Cynara cardunculus var. scolymus]KVI05329.1 Homeodomain-like protein [Cynara cardunculus var. scolymus]